jgi:hypothetical protein
MPAFAGRTAPQKLDAGAKIDRLDYAFRFFFAAHRAFVNADNFFLAAALIGGRVLAVLGADFPFYFAHRCFIALEMRLRAAALIRRRFPPVDVAFGGRPRRGAVEASTSSAEMAWSRRLRSAFKSETRFWTSIEPPQMLRGTAHCSSRTSDLRHSYWNFTFTCENRNLGIAKIGAPINDPKKLGHNIIGYHDPENSKLYIYKLIPPEPPKLPPAFKKPEKVEQSQLFEGLTEGPVS